MKIKRHFIDEFFSGDINFEILGLKVLHVQILFRLYKGYVPMQILFGSFNKEDIEYFINAGIIAFDKNLCIEGRNCFLYTEGGF